jgi:hypothetical protein
MSQLGAVLLTLHSLGPTHTSYPSKSFIIRTSKVLSLFVPLIPLESALPFSASLAKSFRIRTSVKSALNPFRIRTYKKKGGVGLLTEGLEVHSTFRNRPFLFMHLRNAPFATSLFSHSCKMVGGVPPYPNFHFPFSIFRLLISFISTHLQMPSLQPLSFQIITDCPGVYPLRSGTFQPANFQTCKRSSPSTMEPCL